MTSCDSFVVSNSSKSLSSFDYRSDSVSAFSSPYCLLTKTTKWSFKKWSIRNGYLLKIKLRTEAFLVAKKASTKHIVCKFVSKEVLKNKKNVCYIQIYRKLELLLVIEILVFK